MKQQLDFEGEAVWGEVVSNMAWPKRGRVSNWSPLSSPFAGDLEQRLLELQDLIERDRGRDFYLEVLQQRIASLFVRRGASRESPPPSMIQKVRGVHLRVHLPTSSCSLGRSFIRVRP